MGQAQILKMNFPPDNFLSSFQSPQKGWLDFCFVITLKEATFM